MHVLIINHNFIMTCRFDGTCIAAILLHAELAEFPENEEKVKQLAVCVICIKYIKIFMQLLAH